MEDRATVIGRTIYLEELYLNMARDEKFQNHWSLREIKHRLDQFHEDTTVKDVCKYGSDPNVDLGYNLEKEFIGGFLSQL